MKLSSLLPLACIALVPNALAEIQCTEFAGVSLGTCMCEGEGCEYSVTYWPTSFGWNCGNCRWNYDWSVVCPFECGAAFGGGVVDLECDPHQRGGKDIAMSCPAGGIFGHINFGCSYCGS